MESAYQVCLAAEFAEQGLQFDSQVDLPIVYRGKKLGCGYRMDFVVEDSVVVEIKSAEGMDPLFQAQLLSYLRLSGYKIGLLINFKNTLLKSGIKRLLTSFETRHPLRPLRLSGEGF